LLISFTVYDLATAKIVKTSIDYETLLITGFYSVIPNLCDSFHINS
jgi:hypothetical protein